jgi:hypothetical protein
LVQLLDGRSLDIPCCSWLLLLLGILLLVLAGCLQERVLMLVEDDINSGTRS